MKIGWHSNSEWAPTGYGNQTAVFVPRLQKLGHTVDVSAFYGLVGAALKLNNTLFVPGIKHPYGDDILVAHAEAHSWDIVIGLHDIFALSVDTIKNVPFYGWTPVDHDPAPPAVIGAAKAARGVIAFSRFGQAKLREAGIEARYVPHGVDTKVFAPREQAAARKAISADPDKFIAGMVLANKGTPSRKCFDQQIRAFAAFHERHPDTLLYLHTDTTGIYNGEPVDRIVKLAGLEQGAVARAPQYELLTGGLSAEYMANVYNACDVILNATRGEGFGIPIVEAQACGTPVIVTDFSAMAELCFGGWKVGYVDRFFTNFASYQVIPAVDEIADALERAYSLWKKGELEMLGEEARLGALEYDADVVTQRYWKPVLDEIEAEVTGGAVEVTGPVSVDGVGPLTVTRNRTGGYAEVVAREIITGYGLDEMTFEPGDVILDIGAHVGMVSLYLAKKWPEARIIAFEPMPENYAHLVANLKANGTQNVTPVNMAVTADGRDVVIEGDLNDNSGGCNIYGAPGTARHTAKSMTPSEIFRQFAIERVALLKLDCEGAEHEIVGYLFKRALFDKIRAVRAEIHENNVLTSVDETIAFLETCVPDAKYTRIRMADSVTGPDVTVIIPTYNGEATIERAVAAALEQSVRVQVIVVDDGSTDGTAERLKEMEMAGRFRANTSEVYLHFQEANTGQVPAMNWALERATGRYILFHGDDDWLEPDGLRPLVERLDELPDKVAFAYGHWRYHDLRHDIVRAKPFDADDYRTHFPAGNGLIWRTKLRDRHDLRYRTLHAGKTGHAEDFDLVLQLVELGYEGIAVDHLVLNMTLAPGRATAWVHSHRDQVEPEFKKRHPSFVGRL